MFITIKIKYYIIEKNKKLIYKNLKLEWYFCSYAYL